MKPRRLLACLALGLLLAAPGVAYIVEVGWDDSRNIVMDDVFLPAAAWSLPAQNQLAKWNEVDTADFSHPFRISLSPKFDFRSGDGHNTMGFLGEVALRSQYGLSYLPTPKAPGGALAWTLCRKGLFAQYGECDIMLDPTLPWSLSPDDNAWFQQAVLHEAGHARGLQHYDGWLSIENVNIPGFLIVGDQLYMDDFQAIRKHSTTVSERDIAIYRKWHDGSSPQWMTMSPTTVREGQTVNFYNINVENRGSLPFTTPVTFNIVMSSAPNLSVPITVLNKGTFASFGTYTYSVFNWSAKIPKMAECTTRYIGAIIPSDPNWSERFQQNNSVAFSNGAYNPTPIQINLAPDLGEPNETASASTHIPAEYYGTGLSLDRDSDVDYYRFTLPSFKRVLIYLTSDHSLGNIDLMLLNSSGIPLAASIGTTGIERIEFGLDIGSWYIRVHGVGAGSCNRYTLRVASGDCLKDGDCDNGTYCSNMECSDSRTCVPAPNPCNDLNPCTLDLCSESSGGVCAHPPDPGAGGDPDHDGICEAGDNCASIYNPGQEDLDFDGLGDPCDPDADADSMPDAGDCRPSHPAYKSPPGPVTDVVWDGSIPPVMTWTSQSQDAGPGTVYDVAIGASGSAASFTCKASHIAIPSLQVPDIPAAGSALFLLVRATNGCEAGVSTYGEGNGPPGLGAQLDASSPCDGALCGDAAVDPGEQCDDGNTSNTDPCVSSCQGATCGDGFILIGVEQCDDGNTDSSDGCSALCVREAACGDGVLDPGERCDNGALNSDTTPDACRTTCVPARCGDGVADNGESCDDGNNFDFDRCAANCAVEPYCGDGIPGQGEQCDDGNNVDGDGCSADCTPEFCGNGIVEPEEQCDDGNSQGGDGCSPNCAFETFCGNGIADPGEQCDDGNAQSGDGCSANCTRETICGDGATDPGEQCDRGAHNSDTAPDACRSTCVPAHCGDAVIDTGEQCDDGNPIGGDGCSPNCTFESICGNGILEPGEQCDDGNTDDGDGCSATCTLGICGNGIFEQGEQCDNGALNNNTVPDACRTTCVPAHCGDRVIDTGEQCDDGNIGSGDGCSAVCMFETVCGNLVIEPGEQCDDGDTVNGDGCSSTCMLEGVCGNGVIELGEECDNGALNSDTLPDACRTSCLVPYCGDGVTDAGEQCDDGNTAGGDGCSASCTVE